MKVLVLGGAGYIGSCCVENLLEHGCQVVVMDSLIKGHRQAIDPRVEFVEADISDRAALDEVLESGDFVGVIHFAAFIEAGESMEDPGRYFRNNVARGLNLLDALVAHRVPKIVFSSTAAVYGNPETVPIPESSPEKPINAYGESKIMFERILRWYQQIHGLDYVALRYFNAAGATARYGEDHRPETHLLPLILQTALGQREAIYIFGEDYETPDGTCIRDYIHISDLAEAHWLALRKPESGFFNLGSGSGYSVRQMIEVAREVTGCEIPVKKAPRRPGDPDRLISDSTLAREVLGWRPIHDNIHDIVASAWQWKQAWPEGYQE